MSKIAIVLHDLRGGGAEKMMVRLANQLAENGDDITMILITGGGENKAYLDNRVNLIELNCTRTLSAFSPLRKVLKKLKPQGILAALTHVNVITSITCLSLGWLKKLHVSERNAFSLDKKVNSSVVMKSVYFLAPWFYRFIPNPVIAVSQGVADDLIESTIVRKQDVTTAPNPVITAETIAAAKQGPQHPWLVNKETKILIAVGRLAHQKGFDMLIDAFSQISKQIDCKLIIFGEGELRKQHQKQIETLDLTNKISMPGYTNNPIAEMKAADLYVLSSRFEGSPNAIVEAMSVNTPVVAFDCPHGAREILQDGDIPYLVPNGDVNALSKACIKSLKNYTKPKYNEAVKRFNSKESAEIYIALILS